MKLPFRSAPLAHNATFNRLRQLCCTALAAGLLSHQAQAQDSTLTRLVHKYQFDLTQTNGQFSGPGWEKLQQDIRKSQLVLVGEDHGLAQIPVFTTAIAEELKPALYVAEIDKYQAQDLNRLAAQPGLPTTFSKQYPMDLSFYSWKEEFELARYLRSQKVPILGIEQVGSVTPGRFFGLMAEKVKSKQAKAYLQQRAAIYQARDRASMVSGKFTGSTMIGLRQSGIDSLRTFTQHESSEVRTMVEEFVTSYQIYQGQVKGTGGHRERISLMKRNLLQELQPYQKAGQPLPKMLFKFGANHAARGMSMWGDIYDVGNLALNLADAHDQKTLHIFIIGKQGAKVGGDNPDDFSKNAAAYTNADEAILKPFMAQTKAGSAWQAFDLRPLRRALLQDKLTVKSQEQEAMILGYDYLVVIPESTASQNY